MTIKAVVFDFGGVLIDWNREYLYKHLIPDATERRWFLDKAKMSLCKGRDTSSAATLKKLVSRKLVRAPARPPRCEAGYNMRVDNPPLARGQKDQYLKSSRLRLLKP
jgi:hypothetical protein